MSGLRSLPPRPAATHPPTFKIRSSQCEPNGKHVVAWLFSSTPFTEPQPKWSLAASTSVGITSFHAVYPRSENACMTLVLGNGYG